MLAVKERVANGVKFLDEEYPDWREKINPETRNMRDCITCVVGQVLGYYSLLSWDGKQRAVELGFVTGGHHTLDSSRSREWDELKDAWVWALRRN